MSKAILGLVAGAALASFASGALAQNFDDPKEFQAAKDLLAMTPEGPGRQAVGAASRRQGSRHVEV